MDLVESGWLLRREDGCYEIAKPKPEKPQSKESFPPGHHLDIHPLCEMFPLMSDAELVDLTADIKTNGLREPLKLFDDQILDGRNRYTALLSAELPIPYRVFTGTEAEALNYVISKNLKRRHLDTSQRAMVAARIANMRQGERTDLPSIDGKSISQSAAADMLHVGVATVERAAMVSEAGVPEVTDAVQKGELAVSAAAVIARQEPEVQLQIVKAAPKERKAAVRKLRAHHPAGSSRANAERRAYVEAMTAQRITYVPPAPSVASPKSDHIGTAVRLHPWDIAAAKAAFAEAGWSHDELRALRDAIDEILSTPVMQ